MLDVKWKMLDVKCQMENVKSNGKCTMRHACIALAYILHLTFDISVLNHFKIAKTSLCLIIRYFTPSYSSSVPEYLP